MKLVNQSSTHRLRTGIVAGSVAGLALASAYLGAPTAGAISPRQTKPAHSTLDRGFIAKYCLACHNATSASGGLNLSNAEIKPTDSKSFALWVKLHDRVLNGEMPPKSAAQPTPAARTNFLANVSRPLIAQEEETGRREGRSVWRRMNRYEYENTLCDLLDAPWLQIKEMLPEDGLAYRFNKVGSALDISYVQMSRYLAAAQFALNEVMAKQVTQPPTTTRRYYTREQRSFVGLAKFNEFNGSPERATFPIIGNEADIPALEETGPMTVGSKDPVKRETEGMGVVASAYEPLQPKFNQFRAPVAGRYKLRICAHSFWAGPESPQRWWHPSRKVVSAGRTEEPISLYASFPPQRLRKLGSVDAGKEPTVGEMEVDLLKGESIEPDAVRFFRSRPPGWHNPLAQKDGQPGVCFHWLEVVGPIQESWPGRGHKLMFGDLALKSAGVGKVEAVSTDPDGDTTRLLRGFMQRAIRRPILATDIDPYVKLARKSRDAGSTFTESMITAYSAVLCSPGFVTLEEKPGPLDDYALASRLSYFLWNSEPDATLRKLADQGALRKPGALAAQAERLIADKRSHRFSDAFLDYWLDLRKTDNTSPDEELYPDYYLDDYLVESSIDETRAFFAELLRGDLPSRNLVASDFVTINDRLATLYGIPGVSGSGIRRVELPKDSVRGGLLTQASVLKVTANGTTTSPVIRGAWICERILGQPVPPPPPGVAAVEPDIRGAATIREQLAKHRTQPTCASCHTHIDPPGFALENFDVFGGWRDKYRALGKGPKVAGFGKNGQPFDFYPAQNVDPSGELTNGRKFEDVRGLKRLLLQDERQVARNLARQLVTYSTGAPISFADRAKVEAILDRTKAKGYGVKSIIHAIVESDLFRSK
ncbi:MAG: DUF1592 domain-containing protein [Chthonomonadales bacterium]